MKRENKIKPEYEAILINVEKQDLKKYRDLLNQGGISSLNSRIRRLIVEDILWLTDNPVMDKYVKK